MSKSARSSAWCCVLLLLAVVGCKTTPDQGPIYKLHLPELAAPVAPVAVSITDKRPSNERSYHRGAIEPARYQEGIETLTLDNFEPQITDLLKQVFAQRLSTLSAPPVWADIEVRRFRALIDRREILAAEYERQLINESPTVGIGIGGPNTMGNIAGGVAAGIMAAAATTEKLRVVDAHRTSWDHAMHGITCEIEMHVVLHWPNEQRAEFDVTAKSHSMPQENEGYFDIVHGHKWDIAPTVEQVVTLSGDNLIREAQAKLSGIAVKPDPGGPQKLTKQPAVNEVNDFEPAEEPEPLPPPRSSSELTPEPTGAVKL